MTTIDQWELADLAKELGGLYRQLDARKHEKTQAPRGERVMKPTPGPREPAAGWAISLDAQLTAELHEMTRDAINYTDRRAILLARNGTRLCSTIRSNAMEIAEQFPAANDLADLMRDQAAQLERKLTPVAHVQVEQRQTARSITHRLTAQGYQVSTDLIRKWAERGHISRRTMNDGKAGYLATEVLGHAAGHRTAP